MLMKLVPMFFTAMALGVVACAPEAPPAAQTARPATAAPQNVQQGYGTSQEDVFVTRRGGSSAGMQNPVATGRDESGVVRTGQGRGSAGTAAGVRMRQDGTGGQSVDRGPGVGAPTN